MKNSKHEYFHEVAKSLGACQLVEFELKLYIAQAFDVIKKRVDNVVHFDFSGDDYQSASLDRLINGFKKLTSNVNLVRELEKFKSKRDFIAHRAIISCLDPDGSVMESYAEEAKPKLAEITKEANRLAMAIYDESFKFLVHYYLDNDK